MQRPALTAVSFEAVVLCGISPPFGRLSPAQGNVTHVLLTRAPLYQGRSPFSCDLHVLGAPLTFVLSQDQTLQLNLVSPRDESSWFRGANGARLWLGMRDRFGHRSAEMAGRNLASPKTHSSSPLAQRVLRSRQLRAYDSVFKDRGSRWLQGRGRYSSGPRPVRQVLARIF